MFRKLSIAAALGLLTMAASAQTASPGPNNMGSNMPTAPAGQSGQTAGNLPPTPGTAPTTTEQKATMRSQVDKMKSGEMKSERAAERSERRAERQSTRNSEAAQDGKRGEKPRYPDTPATSDAANKR